MPAIGLCSLVLLVVCSFRSPLERVLPDAAFSVFGLLYCGLTLATLPLIWVQQDGPSLLVFLFCVVWTGDTAALYVGRNFGRHKLAPRISPKRPGREAPRRSPAACSSPPALVAFSRSMVPSTLPAR